MTIQELKDKFVKDTKKHIELVNYYGSKLGMSFPDHDHSKLDMLLSGYCYFSKPKEERTEEEQAMLDLATLIHIRNASHHPEYWTKTDLKGFSRDNYAPNGIIDATEMPEESLVELVCDWKATGDAKGNTVEWWFEQVNGKRWLFSKEQQDYIRELMEKLS